MTIPEFINREARRLTTTIIVKTPGGNYVFFGYDKVRFKAVNNNFSTKLYVNLLTSEDLENIGKGVIEL